MDIIAIVKNLISRHLNEGNDILSPSDLKKALESNNGMKGLQACIISIDNEKEPKVKSKIKQISLLNNFDFEEDSITARKAYEIGNGRTVNIKYIEDPNLDCRDMAGLAVSVITPGN